MVHYLYATEEQISLANTAREICEKYLAPQIADIEKAGGGFPMDVVKKLAEAGYASMGIPERWGGLGFDYKTMAIVFEEMAQVDGGFSFSFQLATSACTSIETTAMTKEQKQEIFNGVMAGDIIWATALTEAEAGSDTRNIRTTAVLDGDEWVLNGTKCFITNGGVANYFTISAYVDKSKGAAGIAQFIVPKSAGVQVGKIEDKCGLKLSVTSELILDNVRVPKENMVGSIFFLKPEEAKELPQGLTGNAAILKGLGVARITNMVHTLGMGQRALDETVKYTKERRQFGKRVIDHEGLGFKIADMQTKINAARALIYYSIDALDNDLPLGTLSSGTKTFVSEAMFDVCVDALQCHGGYGYMHDYPIEKLMRDTKIFTIFEGTNEINRMIIARELAGKDTGK